jgi:hypothetical protein
MTKSEYRMTNEWQSSNDEERMAAFTSVEASSFGFPSSFDIRASSLLAILACFHFARRLSRLLKADNATDRAAFS